MFKLRFMLKSLFISLNLIGLAMLPFLYVGDVNIEHQAPSEIEAGGEVEVTITLNKGSITGPARLKLDFTDAVGMEAEGIENAGASFSFAGDNALFIWYSIQADEQVTLKYKLKASAAAAGTKTISGTFSFLDEEERKTKDIPTIVIHVNGSQVTSTGTETNTTETTNTTESTNSAETASANSNDPVSCTRSIEKSGEDFVVTINVDKGSNHGFARIKDMVPAGFKAESMDNSGAVFKYVDNSAKFLWTSLPADQSTITVKYKLVKNGAGAGTYNVAGEFSGEFLIVNDKPQTVVIPTQSFTIEGESIASNGGNNGNSNSNGNSNGNTNTNTSVPSSSNGVSYKVQVMAAHRTVTGSYIKKHYGYSGKVDLENHDGWVKYTTGSFGVYKDARDKRNSLSSYNFPGPFVTAYKDGERITVQEALMITNQQWVQ